MYLHHKILALMLFAIVVGVSYKTDLRLTANFVGHLITFFSIVFGFYLTGLSILFGSNFSKRLRMEEDARKKTQTKLHTLKAYFNFSSFTSLSSIILLLLISLMGLTVDSQNKVVTECMSLWKLSICWDQLLTSMTLGLATINIMFMYLLFQVFFNGFLEEASESE